MARQTVPARLPRANRSVISCSVLPGSVLPKWLAAGASETSPLRWLAPRQQDSKAPLWGLSPRPYAYEAHALQAELRKQLIVVSFFFKGSPPNLRGFRFVDWDWSFLRGDLLGMTWNIFGYGLF